MKINQMIAKMNQKLEINLKIVKGALKILKSKVLILRLKMKNKEQK
jgi:hypothetical protein